MQADYKPFIDRVIGKYEGGYGWDKGDKGGPTKYGITCYDLAEHRRLPMQSMSQWAPVVRAMTLTEAEDIYATKYAAGMRFNDLPAGVDIVLCDYAINSGLGRANIVASALAGLKGSAMTSTVVAAINKMDTARLINSVCDERLRYMHAIRGGIDWQEFGHGWQARVDDVRAYALHIASAKPASTAPGSVTPRVPKAINVGTKATAPSSGGAVATTASTYALGAPLWAAIGIGAAVLAAGVGYELWSARQAKIANATVHA